MIVKSLRTFVRSSDMVMLNELLYECAPHLQDLRDGEVGQPDPGPGGDDAGEQHSDGGQVGPGVLGLAPAGYSGVGGGVGELAGAEG